MISKGLPQKHARCRHTDTDTDEACEFKTSRHRKQEGSAAEVVACKLDRRTHRHAYAIFRNQSHTLECTLQSARRARKWVASRPQSKMLAGWVGCLRRCSNRRRLLVVDSSPKLVYKDLDNCVTTNRVRLDGVAFQPFEQPAAPDTDASVAWLLVHMNDVSKANAARENARAAPPHAQQAASGPYNGKRRPAVEASLA